MSLEWWEYYEIRHNFKNLQLEVDSLKSEVVALKAELARLKGTKEQD